MKNENKNNETSFFQKQKKTCKSGRREQYMKNLKHKNKVTSFLFFNNRREHMKNENRNKKFFSLKKQNKTIESFHDGYLIF